MKLVWIASPLRGNTEENLAYARCATNHALNQGEAPFVPHLLYPQVLDDTDPDHRTLGMQCGWEFMAVCDLVTFYVDRGWSEGMIKDLKIARRLLAKPIEVRRLSAHAVTTPSEVADLLLLAGIIEPLVGGDFPGNLPGDVEVFAFRRDE